jgi:hypothetical protein
MQSPATEGFQRDDPSPFFLSMDVGTFFMNGHDIMTFEMARIAFFSYYMIILVFT